MAEAGPSYRRRGPKEWLTLPGRLLLIVIIVACAAVGCLFFLGTVDILPDGSYPIAVWILPVVMGGQVWVTTATVDGHDFYAIGVDAKTGKILFNEKVFHSENPEPLGNGASMNCYATPSPAIEAGHVRLIDAS